ncbi:hypothetical protein [Kushneria konosiri]|uniref:LicD family protein n=1 Tax=Kushneria konosiri TaxID=698828 RepID=A0A2Z2H9P9_9GAMM|nr:hypothetical protein [Kushneria konosiri]ARS51757.1 hypothetical protein B9G99_01650 [Kushneria konosiri]
MNIELEKSYRLLRFLNASKPHWFKVLFGYFSKLYLFVLGLPPAYRQDTFNLVFEDNGIKIAVRRFIWALHTSWVPIHMRSDYFFDISEHLGKKASLSLVEWLEDNKHILGFERSIWCADLASGLIDKQHENELTFRLTPDDESYQYDRHFKSNINSAVHDIDRLLEKEMETSKVIHFKKLKDSFNKEEAYSALRDTRALFTALGWEWFVISGTFLGAVREQDFLGHDYDIDIGVLYEEFDMAALSAAVNESESWSIKSSSQCLYRTPQANDDVIYHRMEKPILVKIKHHTGLIVDVFIHVRESGLLWHGSAIHRWDNKDFGVAEYFLGKESVKGPDEPDRYLTENYGDWRTPVKKFDCSIDPPNISYSNTAKSVSYLLKVTYRFLLNGEREQARRYIDTMTEKGVLARRDGHLLFED